MLWILYWAIILGTIQHSEPLKCYQCIVFECPTSSTSAQYQEHAATICDSMISFVQQILVKYYPYVKDMRICPPHTEMPQWNDLSLMYPSNQDCPIAYEATRHPYCALGRIRVITTVSSSSSPFNDGQSAAAASDFNVTSHATVLGCITKALLRDITQFKPENKKKLDANLKDTCPFWKFDSPPARSTEILLKHKMELEQCDQLSDLCTIDYGATLKHPSDFDFCILPYLSKVKSFDPLGGDYNSRSKVSFLSVVVIIGLCIGVVIMIASFAGIYYDSR